MRIAIAEIGQETDSFSSMFADLRDFESQGMYFGKEILDRMQGVGPLGGFLAAVAEQPNRDDIELIPIVRAWGGAGGTIRAETLKFFAETLAKGLKEASPLDGVFLALHGAAASEMDDDLEGHLLEVARNVVGREIPLGVTLDHHANITRRMVELSAFLVGHETQPHNPPATGLKAGRLFFRLLNKEVRPTVAWRKIPMITPQDQFLTSQGPMKEWFDLAREMETRPRVLDVSPYPMQPWLDVLEGGWTVVVHTDGDQQLAENLANEIADFAWSRRDRFWHSERLPVAEAVKKAISASKGLVILSDTGDSVWGGAPGESTHILRELIAQNVPQLALVPMVDPPAVQAALAAGVGKEITVELGGKVDKVFNPPLTVTGLVDATSEGFVFDFADRGIVDYQKTALLAVGNVRIALLDHRSFGINFPMLFHHLGVNLNDAKMVVVKTASNFQFYERWRSEVIRVDSPGTTQSNLKDFDWKRVPRPMYPLDDLPEWKAETRHS